MTGAKIAKLPDRRSDHAPLEAVLADVRALRLDVAALRADLRRRPDPGALLAAIEARLGPGTFTGGTLLRAADSDSALADAIAELIDLNAGPHARATALGLVLADIPGIERVGGRRGAALYRLRG